MQQARRLDIIVSQPRKQMKPSQDVMNYLRGRNGTGPEWNPVWDVRISVLQELDRLCRRDPKERILSNAYNELLNELKSTAKGAAKLKSLDEAAKRLLGE